MVNDSYLLLFIIIFIIILLNLFPKTQIRIQHQPVFLHFIILLCIVFLFCMKYEKSALMTSVLYLIMYTQSYKIKEYFASSTSLPGHSLTNTENPMDKISDMVLANNNLPSQITYWYSGDSFDYNPSTKDIQWRDLASSNHITFESSNVKLNSASVNNKSGPQKWISGDTTTKLSIPLSTSTSTNNSVTFIHLTRYSPRTTNRGKLWSSENSQWVSGYNDNKITTTNTDGTELSNMDSEKNGDIMNIRGSNWNLFIDLMDITNKIRTVNVNGRDYIFQNSMQAIPDKIGLNISTGDKSDWECAEIIVYLRILDVNEIEKITSYFNKKYSIKSTDKITADKYNIYNHYTFNSISDSDWQSPPQVGSITSGGNKLLGITDSEYECISLCDKNTSCAAFSYHMGKGVCYLVDEQNMLNHTTSNKSIISGTNKVRENIAQKAKEDAERRTKEEAERIAREEVERKTRDDEYQRQAAIHQQINEKRSLIANNTALPWFNKQCFINVEHKPELNISIGDFCIECWYYENTPTGNNTIIDKGDYNYLFEVRPNGMPSIGFYNRSTGWWYSPGNIPSNQWVHLAISYSKWNRNMTFYMNGNYVSSNTFGADFTATDGPMSIGRQSPDSCNCNYLTNAALFDVRLWNWFRSQYQIMANMRRKIEYWTTGLVANYMMTYRPDLVIYDETGRNIGYISGVYNSNLMFRTITPPYLSEDIPYDSVKRCPQYYNSEKADGNDRCYAGWSWFMTEANAQWFCNDSRGTWIPLDYRYNAYTCQMNKTLAAPL